MLSPPFNCLTNGCTLTTISPAHHEPADPIANPCSEVACGPGEAIGRPQDSHAARIVHLHDAPDQMGGRHPRVGVGDTVAPEYVTRSGTALAAVHDDGAAADERPHLAPPGPVAAAQPDAGRRADGGPHRPTVHRHPQRCAARGTGA